MEPTALILALVQPRLPRGSVHDALRFTEALCARMRERHSLCLRLLARLRRLWSRELQSAPTVSSLARTLPALGAFGQLLVRFADTLRQYAIEDATFRLLLSSQLLVKLQRLYDGIDAIAELLTQGRAPPQRRFALERLQWAADVRVQMLLDKQRSGYTDALQRELQRIETEQIALAELRDALGGDGRRKTPVLLGVHVADARLVVSTTPARADERWVVRSFSACHLCTPVAFVFSAPAATASSSSTQAFVEAHAAALDALFFDVALSVHAPHECELASEAAEGDDVVAVCASAVNSLVLASDDAEVERSLLVPCPH